jgi:glucokinase
MSSPTAILGIDIGGTAIKGLVLADDGAVLGEATLATGDKGNESWYESVVAVVETLRNRVPAVAMVGLCAPGLASRKEDSIVSMPGRLRGLEGLQWGDRLGLPTCVLNDAHAALLGEVWRGAARGAEHALMVTLGTGVGGAAMVDGRLLRGNLGRAGHFGHLSLDPEGQPDIVGTPGSLENAIGDCTVRSRSSGRFENTQALLAAVVKGDQEARRVWDKSLRALAAALTGLINAFDPQVIVLGGGVAAAGDALFQPLRHLLDRTEWRIENARVALVPAVLGAQAGAFGAAFRVRQKFISS